MSDLLPDSRLREKKATLMVDWELPGWHAIMKNGKLVEEHPTVRIEVEPIYCVGCGKPWGYVPVENTVQATYICQKCFEADPAAFAGLVASDEQFCQDVGYEMEARFGKGLDPVEIARAIEGNVLGTALEKLLRESPYPSPDNRPKG